MAAITQPRAGVPYTGRRYGSFDRSRPIAPDFMRGTLRIVAYVDGKINIAPSLRGEIGIN